MIKRILLLFLAIVPVIACAGCAAVKEPAATPVRVVLDWLPNTNHTGLYVALDKGWFAEEGLNVTISEPPEDGALTLLASGKAEFAVSFQDEMAAALTAEQPYPITAVAALISHNTSGILSLKETGISSAKDMAGHSYATWDMPVEQAVLRHVVEKDGGDFSQIKMIPSTVTDVITALQTGVDAVWVFYAWDGVAAQVKGLDTNFFYFRDIEPALDFYTPLLASGEEFLKNNPETARKFLKAAARGYEFSMINTEEAAEILCKYAPETDYDIAAASQAYLSGEYARDTDAWGRFDPARWDAFYSWLYERGVIPQQLAPGQGFTNDYLPR